MTQCGDENFVSIDPDTESETPLVGMDQTGISRSAAYRGFPSYPRISYRHPQDLDRYPDD